MATWNLHAELDFYCVTALLSLGNIEKAVHILGVLAISTKLIPSRLIH